MAYHNGVWESDRETRRRNEQMWNADRNSKGSKDPKDHRKDPPRDRGHGGGVRVGAKDDDLTRAMREDLGTTGTAGTMKPAGVPLMGSGYGSKIDRPIIPGGCHHTGRTLALTLSDGKRLYGAQAHSITQAGHLDLIVDCAGLLKARPRFVAKATAPRFRTLDTSAYPDVVTLAWPDMTAPTQVGIKFWLRLRDLLPQDTAFCCMGGHGRTGTALAAILVADGEDPETAMKRVRKDHCPRAIETREQEHYIRALATERDARVKGRGVK